METDQTLRIMFVEDLPTDVELSERELRKSGLKFTSIRVETKDWFSGGFAGLPSRLDHLRLCTARIRWYASIEYSH